MSPVSEQYAVGLCPALAGGCREPMSATAATDTISIRREETLSENITFFITSASSSTAASSEIDWNNGTLVGGHGRFGRRDRPPPPNDQRGGEASRQEPAPVRGPRGCGLPAEGRGPRGGDRSGLVYRLPHVPKLLAQNS